MKEMKRAESVASERAVLVGVLLADQDHPAEPLEELEGLAEAAGAQVVGELTQRRPAPDAATYLGKGKVEELKRLADFHDADVIVFDNDLGAAQVRNLEKTLALKVVDRTELILDIFATRAQTYEARLAVELAQLEYSMPRLKRMWTHLSRQAQAASDCGVPARSSWKSTGGWSSGGSPTCGANSMPSTVARSGKWPPGGAR